MPKQTRKARLRKVLSQMKPADVLGLRADLRKVAEASLGASGYRNPQAFTQPPWPYDEGSAAELLARLGAIRGNSRTKIDTVTSLLRAAQSEAYRRGRSEATKATSQADEVGLALGFVTLMRRTELCGAPLVTLSSHEANALANVLERLLIPRNPDGAPAQQGRAG